MKLSEVPAGQGFSTVDQVFGESHFIKLDVVGSKNNVVNVASWRVGSMGQDTEVEVLGPIGLIKTP